MKKLMAYWIEGLILAFTLPVKNTGEQAQATDWSIYGTTPISQNDLLRQRIIAERRLA